MHGCSSDLPVEQVWLKRLTNPEPGHKAVAGERASFLIFDPIAWDLVSISSLLSVLRCKLTGFGLG